LIREQNAIANQNMKTTILFPLSLAAILTAGCSTPSSSSSAPAAQQSSVAPKASPTAFEGSWKGREVTADHEGSATLIVTGQTIDFHGADPSDWVKGTYTLREDITPKQVIGTVTECDSAEVIGKNVYAIYKIEDGTLTITGNGPGDPNFPTAFDASGSRQFVFKHAQ
jgi:uncharacterized protein (TIGR03067 family)